jgi:hypothetical protein
MKYSFWTLESVQEPSHKGAPNSGCEAQGQPIKNFFGHRDSLLKDVSPAEGGADDKKRLRR